MKKQMSNIAIILIGSLLINGSLSAADVFTEDFSFGIGAWTPGVERDDHRGDSPNDPAWLSGGAVLSSESSCFSAPFNGVATTLTRSIYLESGTYTLAHLVSHSTELYGFCSGGTGGQSQVLIDGVVVTSVGIGVSGSCSVATVPLEAQFNCFQILEDGYVDIKLRTSGGDCARVVGFFDDIVISEAADWDGDGIADVCDDDDDNDGVLDGDDDCQFSDTSETVSIDGCDTGVSNILFENGCTISDLIGQCADGVTNHGEFVSCVASLTNQLKKEGHISGKEKGLIQKCAAQADLP